MNILNKTISANFTFSRSQTLRLTQNSLIFKVYLRYVMSPFDEVNCLIIQHVHTGKEHMNIIYPVWSTFLCCNLNMASSKWYN